MNDANSASPDGWNPELYSSRHDFVWRAGAGIVDWLDARPGERVLDLGCGTGELTARLAESGAVVAGLDASSAMIATARAAFPDVTFEVSDARTLTWPESVDAVFSNAALHWIRPPETVAARVAAALRPGGRFVAEFGGAGNVAAVTRAVTAARIAAGFEERASPWYFPTLASYAGVLEDAGLSVRRAELFERPTPLEGDDGLRAWLTMFGAGLLDDLPDEAHDAVVRDVERRAAPTLWRGGVWQLDYVRLRVLAVRT